MFPSGAGGDFLRWRFSVSARPPAAAFCPWSSGRPDSTRGRSQSGVVVFFWRRWRKRPREGIFFHLLESMFDFPLLVLKGIHHYWIYIGFKRNSSLLDIFLFFPWGLNQMEVLGPQPKPIRVDEGHILKLLKLVERPSDS